MTVIAVLACGHFSPTSEAGPEDGGRGSMDDQEEGLNREADVRAREAALDARELDIGEREDADADRAREAQGILDDADERDDVADARDTVADERDRAASLHSFRHEPDGSAGLKARRSAGLDRADAKSDRALSAEDRTKLAGRGETEEPPPSE
jgi:hypothetical protein